MNWTHLRTFLWLYWRLACNRLRREGLGGAAVEIVLASIAVFTAIVTCLVGFTIGFWGLAKSSSIVVMLVWDGVVVGFLLMWASELLLALQRSEDLPYDNFQHLPVSLAETFLAGYLGSFFSPSWNVFLPAMIGLAAGLVLSKGLVMFLVLPGVAAFFWMMVAVGYQFRKWLASSMRTPQRSRNAYIIGISVLFFAILIPALWKVSSRPNRGTNNVIQQETERLDRGMVAGERSVPKYNQEYVSETSGVGGNDSSSRRVQDIAGIAMMINRVAPPGWLPYCAESAAEGANLAALSGIVAMVLIGTISLASAYKSAGRLRRGGQGRRNRKAAGSSRQRKPTSTFIGKRLPWLSEPASAAALSGVLSMCRLPEMKAIFIGPLTISAVFLVLLKWTSSLSTEFLPLYMAGVMGMILHGATGIAGNLFGIDRGGFRLFVLAPVSRRDILLGKNLALMPFVLGLGLISAGILELAFPTRIDRFGAGVLQMIMMYLEYCVLTNFLSIYSPMPMMPRSLKIIEPRGMAVLYRLGLFLLFPSILLPALIPLVLEYLSRTIGVARHYPILLAATLMECALVSYLYPFALKIQGNLLQDRELHILEVVTSNVE